jgi:RimJ/RimL family protein N-acetyltransferase
MSTLRLRLRELAGNQAAVKDLQQVFEATSDYLYRITGLAPTGAEAQSTISFLPDGKSYNDKFIYGIFVAEQMVGCADVIRGFPVGSTATIGLLLIAEVHQGKGYGALAYSLLEERIQSWEGISRIRIGVVRRNAKVLPFWKKLGFIETGQVVPFRHDNLTSETVILEKGLLSNG